MVQSLPCKPLMMGCISSVLVCYWLLLVPATTYPVYITLQILDANSVSRLEYSWAGLWHCSGCTGTDSRVRLWDMQSGCNTLVNYEATRIRTHQGTQLAVSSDSSLLFVASAHSIQVTITTLCNTTNTPYCPYWMLDFSGLWGWKEISNFQNIITIAFNEPLYTQWDHAIRLVFTI
jgi:hypothetical protein